MTVHYRVADTTAWVDASEGMTARPGPRQPFDPLPDRVWVCRLPDGPPLELNDRARRIWLALADPSRRAGGPCTAAEILDLVPADEVPAEERPGDYVDAPVTAEEIAEFLRLLGEHGLVTVAAGPD